ncbi:MAG: DUF4013 domain-containing protein [archaeon]|nr:DUF4013 domain-containing protein [archaeon]
MTLDSYKDAMEYSAQDGKRLIKLGIICLFNFLILPIFLQLGYSYRVTKVAVKGMINGDDALPDFSDAISMFIDGLKIFVVKFVYIIVPIIIFAVFMWAGRAVGGSAGGIITGIGVILTVVIGVVAYILSDLAVCHMAAEDEALSTAFDIKSLRAIAKSIGWLRLIGFYIGLLLIMLIITLVVILVLVILFTIFGIFGSALAGGAGLVGVLGVGFIVMFAIFCFIVGPFLSIFEARSIGLVYNLKE